MENKELAIYKITRTLSNSKEIQKLINQYNLCFKEGKFSRKEMKIVDNEIKLYMSENNINRDLLEEWALSNNVSGNLDIKKLCSLITDKLKYRTYRSVYSMLNHIFNPYLENKFNPEMDRKLLNLVAREGRQWKKYEPILERYRKSSIQRYNTLLDLGTKKITKKMLESLIENGFPKTESEYNEITKKTGLSIKTIKKKIKFYIKGKNIDIFNDLRFSITFQLLILNNNFSSKLNFNIIEINESIDNIKTNIKDLNILNFVNSFIVNKENINLDIPIEKEDIFWNILSSCLKLDNETLKSKYYELQSEYNWKTYKDILRSIKSILIDYLEEKKTQYYINKLN